MDLSNTDPVSILGQLERLTFKSPYLEEGHFQSLLCMSWTMKKNHFLSCEHLTSRLTTDMVTALLISSSAQVSVSYISSL